MHARLPYLRVIKIAIGAMPLLLAAYNGSPYWPLVAAPLPLTYLFYCIFVLSENGQNSRCIHTFYWLPIAAIFIGNLRRQFWLYRREGFICRWYVHHNLCPPTFLLLTLLFWVLQYHFWALLFLWAFLYFAGSLVVVVGSYCATLEMCWRSNL